MSPGSPGFEASSFSGALLDPSHAAGFVLAGGQSSRMGRDKALVSFRGRPMIEHALGLLRSAGLAPRIAGARSDLSSFAPVIPDSIAVARREAVRPEGLGPLAGVHAGLSASTAELTLFLPVDMPLMPPALLACILRRAQATQAIVTVCTVHGRIEPFPVVLRKAALAAIETRLAAGLNGCLAAWQAIPQALASELDAPTVETVIQAGVCPALPASSPEWWFSSANTPEELARLEQLSS
jgi:molybdopterin-guanine dinucleotide biosynthesis protein A